MRVEAVLKRYLKRKVTITNGLVITFLITGKILYGVSVENDLYNESEIIEKNKNGVDFIGEKNIDLKNKGTIKGSMDGDVHDNFYNVGNGVSKKIVDTSGIGNILNSGVILGETNVKVKKESSEKNAHIYIEDIGNGISSYSNNDNKIEVKIGDIGNSKSIIGRAIVERETTNTTNKSSDIYLYGGGNGISSYTNFHGVSTIGDIENSGLILGEGIVKNSISAAVLQGVGNGINSYSATEDKESSIGSIKNTGMIIGRATAIGGTEGYSSKFRSIR